MRRGPGKEPHDPTNPTSRPSRHPARRRSGGRRNAPRPAGEIRRHAEHGVLAAVAGFSRGGVRPKSIHDGHLPTATRAFLFQAAKGIEQVFRGTRHSIKGPGCETHVDRNWRPGAPARPAADALTAEGKGRWGKRQAPLQGSPGAKKLEVNSGTGKTGERQKKRAGRRRGPAGGTPGWPSSWGIGSWRRGLLTPQGRGGVCVVGAWFGD